MVRLHPKVQTSRTGRLLGYRTRESDQLSNDGCFFSSAYNARRWLIARRGWQKPKLFGLIRARVKTNIFVANERSWLRVPAARHSNGD
ncbi:MAG TPA: hypothetical protein DDW52_09605 [Planctomycetaceae bacterium]|nr:hypothetical protein [Planctomycetaceae bacterium]